MKKVLIFLILNSLFIIPAFAAVPQELRQAIEEKARVLQEVNDRIQATQKQLNTVQGQKNSLQKELQKIDYSINQLNLGIKSSEVSIEKANLELQELQYDINKINAAISNKKLTLIKLLRELYEKEREGFLAMFLKNKSLADSFLESQSIANLNDGLSLELDNLRGLNKELDGKFQIASDRKIKIENENKNLKNRKIIVQDQKTERQNLLVQTKNQEKVFASLIDNLAERRAEISEEIEKIEEELRSKIDPSLLPIPRPGVLGRPVAGILTQNFGHTPFSHNYLGKFHNGVDFGAPTGTEVKSAESGTVVAVGDQDAYSAACRGGAYGKYVVIEHSNNLTTLYAHLSKQAVKKGDIVKRGDTVGYIGSTGYSTGPHLHFTVYASPTFYMGASRVCGPMPLGGYLNPLDYLER